MNPGSPEAGPWILAGVALFGFGIVAARVALSAIVHFRWQRKRRRRQPHRGRPG